MVMNLTGCTCQYGRMRIWIIAAFALVIGACQSSSPALSDIQVPEVSADQFLADLADSDSPTVVNVWASWCLPCRAEAPLLSAAAIAFSGEINFIGVDVRDRPADAVEFIKEFGLNFPHVADPTSAIPAAMGGIGVPITYFVQADGEIADTHIGIIDERTLVAGIEALLGP